MKSLNLLARIPIKPKSTIKMKISILVLSLLLFTHLDTNAGMPSHSAFDGSQLQELLPEVGTLNMTDISATIATSGGNVTSQGGSEVTARGVAWNTAEDPTIEDDTTFNVGGTGLFRVTVTDLEPGTRYYLRAYATNSYGTAYGRTVSFVTLDSVVAPEVTTVVPSNITANRADVGGNVSHWGGAQVTERGIIWSRSEHPGFDDSYVAEGSGTGSFNATMSPLRPETRYYFKAYSVNEAGTGFGRTISFLTRPADPDVEVIVAQDGSGDYTSIGKAFNDAPRNYTGQFTIHVRNGVYYEKILLEHDRVNVRLIGQSRDSTIITYDDYAGMSSTSESYTVSIDADDFIAKNITIQNTIVNDGSFPGQQAVALSTNGDRQAYYNCSLLGFQDTYYARGSRGTGRIYINNSYIEGNVDFIFGRSIVVIDSSQIHVNRQGGVITAAATEAESAFGFVIRHSEITHDEVDFNGNEINDFHFGRPWNTAPQTVFMHTYLPQALNHAGWRSWNVSPRLYAEYSNYGPGSAFTSLRADFSRQLTDEEADEYTLENIFSKDSHPRFSFDWMPDTTFHTPVSVEDAHDRFDIDRPMGFNLHQNYPNPFNPSTIIGYTLPKTSHVKITAYDVMGREVALLENGIKEPGYHELFLDAGLWANGIYFYRIKAGQNVAARNMLLLK